MFTKIDGLLWNDAKFNKLSNESRFMFMYLVTCPHRNMIGLYSLPKIYIQYSMHLSEDAIDKSLKELKDNGFATYDDEAETVLVNNFIKHNPLDNPNMVKGAVKSIRTIPKTQLIFKLIDILKVGNTKYSEDMINHIQKYAEDNNYSRIDDE